MYGTCNSIQPKRYRNSCISLIQPISAPPIVQGHLIGSLYLSTGDFTSGKENIALNRSAWQSTNQSAYYASLAVNGIIHEDGQGYDFSHTLLQEDQWWRVELSSPEFIKRLVLYNRVDCCSEFEHTPVAVERNTATPPDSSTRSVGQCITQ